MNALLLAVQANCGLTLKEGRVWTFGCNDEGSLGRDVAEEEDCFLPGQVSFLCFIRGPHLETVSVLSLKAKL